MKKLWPISLLCFLLLVPVLASELTLLNPAAVTVTTAGTRVNLTTDSNLAVCRSIYLEGDDGNAGTIFVGNSNVSSTRYSSALSATQGFKIGGESEQDWFDARTVWVDASANSQIVQFSALCVN